jgi:hypothetical protein
MRVVFLDIDGVLATSSTIRLPRGSHFASQFDDTCVKRFNRLVADNDLQIVISSSWRVGRTVDTLQDILDDRGVVGNVIGKTGNADDDFVDTHPQRGFLIQRYLDDNPGITSFVILDDGPDMAHLMPYLCLTTFNDGFLSSHLILAQDILDRQTKPDAIPQDPD